MDKEKEVEATPFYRVVYKYGTGEKVPFGGKYLTTVVEENSMMRLVWHYYEHEVKK